MPNNYSFELSNITLNDGSQIEDRPLTLIIGPNNSGKSRLLKDILNRVTQFPTPQMVVLRNAEIKLPSSPKAFLNSYPHAFRMEVHQQSGMPVYKALGPLLTDEYSASIPDNQLDFDVFRENPQIELPKGIGVRPFEPTFGRFMVALLSAENRLLLTKTRHSLPPQRLSPSLMFNLYESGTSTDIEISKTLSEAFEYEVMLDYSALESLCIRVAPRFEVRDGDARRAREELKSTAVLDDQGDGLRSFTSVVTAMRVEKRPLWLVDEPEAFLHPPQAFKMGQYLAKEASATRRLIVSTHSVDVLRGVLNKTTDVTVIRLTRDGKINRCKSLKPEQLKDIVNTPLLSSSRVLEGLFYSAAVVTEGDADNRFYHTISTRIREDADIHFVNAGNKQTVPRIVGLYKKLGVRCIGLADFDVINDSREFRNHLEELSVPPDEIKRIVSLQSAVLDSTREAGGIDVESIQEMLRVLRSEVDSVLDPNSDAGSHENIRASSKKLTGLAKRIAELTNFFQKFKEVGARALTPEMQSVFKELNAVCQKFGLFINPYGQLESMLTDCEIQYTDDKRAWITEALRLLANFDFKRTKIAWTLVSLIHSVVEADVDRTTEQSASPDV